MNIVADENIDGFLVAALRNAGHSVFWITESNPSIKDDRVLAFSVAECALLITEDKDFGDLIFNHYRSADSVLLLRLPRLGLRERATMIVSIIEENGSNLNGCYSVLTRSKLRIRPLKE